MYCQTCGKPDQLPETFCRQCGVFLPDLDHPSRRTVQPEEHVTANGVLSAMTIAACFSLAFLLCYFLGFRESTHPLIYVTAALLLAMGAWHIQTFWRTLQLRKYFDKKDRHGTVGEALPRQKKATQRLLQDPVFAGDLMGSVTDATTRELDSVGRASTQTEH